MTLEEFLADRTPLRPCPFCGTEAKRSFVQGNYNNPPCPVIHCPECDGLVHPVMRDAIVEGDPEEGEAVIAAWNEGYDRIQVLEEYVGNEMVRSDFRTVRDMRKTLEEYRMRFAELSMLMVYQKKVVEAAIRCVANPKWAGVCDEDVELEQAVVEYQGYVDREAV